ncbi:MAG: hypothetical protein U0T84_06885 [Chitinophagales bacterium]
MPPAVWREKHFVDWLNRIQPDARELFLVGDIFDFWHEYRTAVPRGYTRLLGKLAELSDSGVVLHIFTGNHDLWMDDYLQTELQAHIYRAPIMRELNGKRFFIGHGDGPWFLIMATNASRKFLPIPFVSGCFAGSTPMWAFGWLITFQRKVATATAAMR